jgi:hypothetical protein
MIPRSIADTTAAVRSSTPSTPYSSADQIQAPCSQASSPGRHGSLTLAAPSFLQDRWYERRARGERRAVDRLLSRPVDLPAR